jgi:hypothetical protein
MLAKVTSKNQLTLPKQAMAAIGAVSHFQVVRLAVAGRADFLVSGERARGCVAGANSGDQRVRG